MHDDPKYFDPDYFDPNIVLFLSAVSLLFSAWLIRVGINRDGSLICPGIGLLLFGANLYSLIATRAFSRWNDLPMHKKAIAVIPIVVAVAGMCLLCWASSQFPGGD